MLLPCAVKCRLNLVRFGPILKVQGKKSKKIEKYSQFLKKKISYEEIDIGYDEKKREEMLKKSNGAKTIPQIFIEEKHIGGYVELKALELEGKLDNLLKN